MKLPSTISTTPLFSHIRVRIEDKCLHLSFNFVQNIAYIHLCTSSFQAKFICLVFIVKHKCMNYVIDESFYTGKEANTVISLLHHYLLHHSLGIVALTCQQLLRTVLGCAKRKIPLIHNVLHDRTLKFLFWFTEVTQMPIQLK